MGTRIATDISEWRSYPRIKDTTERHHQDTRIHRFSEYGHMFFPDGGGQDLTGLKPTQGGLIELSVKALKKDSALSKPYKA
ncbi:hypothetical protein KAH39_03935 [Alcaligenes faecalis]|uniref:hypothetical protein n=1 Tax=Alcaligenes faecalis TaxID=511 RepID=UPI0011CF7BD3|nr:hypothetical protein [Alcaligenes faecalis]MBQ0216454.1 hypothetical protein [Alcaligenes faecalis]